MKNVIQILSTVLLILGAFYTLALMWRWMWGRRRTRRQAREKSVGWFVNIRDFVFAVIFLSLGILGLAFTPEILAWLPDFLT